MSGAEVQLAPLLAELAASLVVDAERRCAFPDAPLLRAAVGLIALRGEPEQDEMAEELIAYALKCRRVAGDGALEAVGQLCFLLALLIGEEAALFAARDAGVGNEAQLARAIGLESSKVPVGGERPAGATSPLGARLLPKSAKQS